MGGGGAGGATAEDLRLRGAFARVRALLLAGKQGAVPLVAALVAAWGAADDLEEKLIVADLPKEGD